MFSEKNILIPLDVENKSFYRKNYFKITQGSGNLFLFAGDQKMEHLNDDFFGDRAHADDANPEHLFKIAQEGNVGAFATQLGLIARYGNDYRKIRYVVKLNSKTHLVPFTQTDPVSASLASVNDVINFKKKSGLDIVGIGYTIYLGSEYESVMLHEAAQVVREAHEHGLVAIIWAYPRGKIIQHKNDPHLIAGAAGVGAVLGADFVKVDPPDDSALLFEAVKAAGRTKVICAGGSSKDVPSFLKNLALQIEAGVAGTATGRNIHQKSFSEALKMCQAIKAIVVEHKRSEEALALIS